MGNKSGLIEKLKICAFMLFEPSRKNVLTASCEFCGGTNIIAKNKSFFDGEEKYRTTKTYQAEYVCMNCKAEAKVTQHWGKLKAY